MIETGKYYLIKNANKVLCLKCEKITQTCYLFLDEHENSYIWLEKDKISSEPQFFKYQILEGL